MSDTPLLFTYIKRSVISRPALYVFLIFMQIVSLICIYFVFGLIYRAFTVFEAAKESEKEIYVSFENNNAVTDADRFSTCLDGKTFVDATNELLAFIKDDCNNEAVSFSSFGIMQSGGKDLRFVTGGGDFTKSETGKRIVNINPSSKAFEGVKVGDSVNIGGTDYTVNAFLEDVPFDLTVPDMNNIPDDCKVRDIVITLKNKPSYNDAQEIEKPMQKLYLMPSSIQMPEGLELLDEQLNSTQIAVSVIMILFAVFNCSFCYYYIYLTNKNTLRVFRLCGATTADCRMIYTAEVILHAALSICVSYILYDKVLKAIAEKYFRGIDVCYTAKNYLLVTGAYLIISIMIMAVCMSRFTSKPLAQTN